MTTSLAEAQSASSAARARRAAAAFRGAARVIDVFLVLLPGDADLAALHRDREALAARLNALTTLDPAGQAFAAAVTEAESGVLALERRLLEIDGEIPMGWFREHFDAPSQLSDSIAAYAQLLGRYSAEDLNRLDRVQLLLTRVVKNFVPRADRFVGSRVRDLLLEALPPSAVDARQRETAVQFLRDAAGRARSFTTLRELTHSGFFVDTRGYKLSLRTAILDPDVMAAVIELNETVSEAIDSLARRELAPDQTLAEHLAQVDARIREVFKEVRSDDAARVARFAQRLARNLGHGRAKWRPPGKGPGRAPFRVGLALAILLSGGWLVRQLTAERALHALSAAELRALSPLLVDGVVAPPAQPRNLVAHVDKARWALMRAGERELAAQQLAAALKAQGLVSGTVMLEDAVVIHVEGGRPVLVQ